MRDTIRVEHMTVNKCQDRTYYERAAQRRIALYYTPNPIQPSPDMGKETFEALKKFPVSPEKAMALFEKIKAGMPPETIIKELNLKTGWQSWAEESEIVNGVTHALQGEHDREQDVRDSFHNIWVRHAAEARVRERDFWAYAPVEQETVSFYGSQFTSLDGLIEWGNGARSPRLLMDLMPSGLPK